MSNLKRKIGCESEFNSSDDDDLCAELDSVEVQYKKSKYSFAISYSDILLSMWKTI